MPKFANGWNKEQLLAKKTIIWPLKLCIHKVLHNPTTVKPYYAADKYCQPLSILIESHYLTVFTMIQPWSNHYARLTTETFVTNQQLGPAPLFVGHGIGHGEWFRVVKAMISAWWCGGCRGALHSLARPAGIHQVWTDNQYYPWTSMNHVPTYHS